MKLISILLISLCTLTAMAQYPVSSISISVSNNPPANTTDWATAMPPLMVTAQAKLVQGKMDPRVQESRILVTIKNGSNKICGSFTQQTAPLANFNSATKNWSGAVAIGLLGNSCVLQPGTYQLCVQFFSSYAPIEPLSNEVCKSFTIADTKQSTVIAPQNLMPPDGFITPSPNNGQLTLRWTKAQVVPAPVNSDIMYKVRIIEIKEGQSKTQALQTNTPLDIIEVKNLTQTPYSLHREVDPTGRPSSIVWFVEATNTERVNGQEPKSYGKSEATTITFKKSDEDAKLKELKNYTDTTDSAPPKNVLPVDGKNFTQKEVRQPIQLRWVQILPPPPNNDIMYTVHIYAVEKGQTPAQAAKNNRPVFEKIVKTKETTWQMPNEYANSKETKIFVWNVRATNKEGKAYGRNDGTSEPTSFRSSEPECHLAFPRNIQDSFKVTCKGIDPLTGNTIYNVCTWLYNNNDLTGNPLTVTGLTSVILGNNISNFSPGFTITITAGGISPICFDISAPATQTHIKVQAFSNFSGPDGDCTSNPKSDSIPVVQCICKDCDKIKVNFSNFNTVTSGVNSNQFNLSSSINVNVPVYGLEFEVQSYSYTSTPAVCSNGVSTIEQSGMLLMPGTTINGLSAIQVYNEIASTSGTTNNNASKDVMLLSTTAMTGNIPVNLTIGLPGPLAGFDSKCCKMKYKVCIRVKVFYDKDSCKSCVFTKCFEFNN